MKYFKHSFFYLLLFSLFGIMPAFADTCDIKAPVCFGLNWEKTSLDSVKKIITSFQTKDKEGNTPLHFAARNNPHPEIIEYLIAHGFNVNSRGTKAASPLHLSVAHNLNIEVSKSLISNGALVNSKDKNKISPLHWAARNSSKPELITYLIEQGANIHAKSINGVTPLFWAADSNTNPEVIKALIVQGADINAHSNFGITPLHLAAFNNTNPKIIEMFILEGAKLNILSDSGYTSLHAVVQSRRPIDIKEKIIILLLKHGANPTLRDNLGRTAADIGKEISNFNKTSAYAKLLAATQAGDEE